MKVEIQYQANAKAEIHAAILLGKSVDDWLQAMISWEFSLEDLECYLVPNSIADRKAIGLFVIFPEDSANIPINILHPYQKLGNRLFIPQNARLFPELLPEEMDQIWAYQRQVFHPTIGLIGFEANDRVDFGNLVLAPLPTEKAWNCAQAANPPGMPLMKIELEPKNLDSVLSELKSEVGSKSLEELPKPQKNKWMPRFLVDILARVVELAKTIISGLEKMLRQAEVGEESGPIYKALDAAEYWLEKKKQNLEQVRQNEIERLIQLFKDNPEEALRYALPIDNTALGRGEQGQSTQLHRRNTTFGTGISGSGVGDVWTLGHSQEILLRAKYNQAANDAIENGDFDRAAYIYAHLLNNFRAAANVLVQGKKYREAALIYKEKLKDPQGAAKCLEDGGLYTEAAELHLELKNWEKAADLYKQIGFENKAETLYEKLVSASLEEENYLNAARIAREKLEDSDRESTFLLNGWNKRKHGSTCLERLFKNVLKDEKIEKERYMLDFYKNHVPNDLKNVFLSILYKDQDEWQSAGASDSLKELTFEIVENDLKQNKTDSAYFLGKLYPNDPLIKKDIIRYKNENRALANLHNPSITHLDVNVTWQGVQEWGNAFIAWGMQKNRFIVTRFNNRKISWLSFSENAPEGMYAHLALQAYGNSNETHYGVIASNSAHGFDKRIISANPELGPELQLLAPRHFVQNSNLVGVSITHDQFCYALEQEFERLALLKYGIQGNLIERITINTDPESLIALPTVNHSNLVAHDSEFYFASNNGLCRVDRQGKLSNLEFAWNEFRFALWKSHILYIAIQTPEEIIFYDEAFRFKAEYKYSTIEHSPFPMYMTFLLDGRLVFILENEICVLRIQGKEIDAHRIDFQNSDQIVGIISGTVRGSIRVLLTSGQIIQLRAN